MDDKARKPKMAKFMRKLNKIKYKVKELEIHSDKRGWLVEMLKQNEIKEEIKQVYVATIKPGCVRGNHYHKKRKEWSLILNGKVRVFLENISKRKKTSFIISSKSPKLLTIFPNVAHAIKNVGKEIVFLVSAQSDIYNPKKPDVFPWKF